MGEWEIIRCPGSTPNLGRRENCKNISSWVSVFNFVFCLLLLFSNEYKTFITPIFRDSCPFTKSFVFLCELCNNQK
jgi:hypothetical protein